MRRPGLTLLEATLSMTILPVAVLAIALAITAGQQQSAAAMQQGRAAMLAESLMERIVALPYADPDDGSTNPGPETSEAVPAGFDNADDFCGQTLSVEQLSDPTGASYPEALGRFDLAVTCQAKSLNPLGTDTAGTEITVEVLDGEQRTARITRFLVEPASEG